MNSSEAHPHLARWIEDKRPGMVRLAWKATGNREEAEDAVQETLAAVWRRLGEIRVKDRDAYLARAVWLNALKLSGRRRRHLSLEDFDPAAPEAFDEDKESWDPLAVEEALDKLPEAQKAVVRLKYYGGLTFREIGETLAISFNTASSRCRYALEALREALAPHRRGK